jgi:hypothetical protein
VKDVNGDGALDILLPRIDGQGRATISFAGGAAKEITPKK